MSSTSPRRWPLAANWSSPTARATTSWSTRGGQMATTRKFLFDVSFDDADSRTAPDVPEIEDPPPPAITADVVARPRAEGVAEGLAAGGDAERRQTQRLRRHAVDRAALATRDQQRPSRHNQAPPRS